MDQGAIFHEGRLNGPLPPQLCYSRDPDFSTQCGKKNREFTNSTRHSSWSSIPLGANFCLRLSANRRENSLSFSEWPLLSCKLPGKIRIKDELAAPELRNASSSEAGSQVLFSLRLFSLIYCYSWLIVWWIASTHYHYSEEVLFMPPSCTWWRHDDMVHCTHRLLEMYIALNVSPVVEFPFMWLFPFWGAGLFFVLFRTT